MGISRQNIRTLENRLRSGLAEALAAVSARRRRSRRGGRENSA